MNVYILSDTENLFSKEKKEFLESKLKVVYIKEIKPLSQISEIILDKEEKILAIDPDFCEWNLPASELENIENIKAICLQSTSFSWIDLECCKSKNIPIINIKNWSTESVAEWAFNMALCLARKYPVIAKNDWKISYADDFEGIELKGKTVGIVGLGNIGLRIAEISKAFGMNVKYWSKNIKNNNYTYCNLEELFKTCDVIFPCVSQNKDTEGLITDLMLKSMKKEAIFVSIVHKIYNEELLLELVKNKQIFGYGFEDNKGGILNNFEGNVLAIPSLAWYTKEASEINAKLWIENIIQASVGNYSNRID
jgi:lactate dehydrogenase-like 2-hydroxyacid dehydrogenase